MSNDENNNIPSQGEPNTEGKFKIAITGATGDLGNSLACYLSKAGHTLHLIGRNQEKLLRVLEQVQTDSIDKNHSAHICDIKKQESINDVLDEIVNEHGVPDIIINNAAVLEDSNFFHKYSMEEIHNVIDTNIKGTVIFTQGAIIKALENKSKLKIITIGSTAGIYPYPFRDLYALGKGGLKHFYESMSQEYRNKGIKMNYLCPGPIEGEAINKVIEHRAKLLRISPEKMEESFSKIVSSDGDLLSKEDVFWAIDKLIYDGELEDVAGETFTGHTVGIDKIGIYIKTNPKIIGKNKKIEKIPEEQELEYDKRRYLIKLPGKETKSNKSKTLDIGSLKNALLKYSRYAAILLFLFFAAKAVKIDQKIDQGMANFKELAFNIKDYDNEMRKVAREEYGIDNPEDLITKSNEMQDHTIINLYVEIGQKAWDNMHKYREQGFGITGTDLDAPIDI